MKNLPVSEINESPSVATFQPIDPNSVRARTQVADEKPMPTNGHTLESLRDFAEISRHDKIDQVGIATKALSESATKYAKSETARSFKSWLLKQSQMAKKPKN